MFLCTFRAYSFGFETCRYLWFTQILRWYLYKMKYVICITCSLFILHVCVAAHCLTGARSLGNITLYFTLGTRNVFIYHDVFCNYYSFSYPHILSMPVVWQSAGLPYWRIWAFIGIYLYSSYVFLTMYILTYIRTKGFIAGSLLVGSLESHSLHKPPRWSITKGHKLTKAFKEMRLCYEHENTWKQMAVFGTSHLDFRILILGGVNNLPL